jgi:ceramide glucosyltransferase
LEGLRLLLLLAILSGCACWLAVLLCTPWFRARKRGRMSTGFQPALTLLKPVYGLEKNLYENLRTACMQDYPEYQVVYSVQRKDDPAIPLLCQLQAEYGRERVSVVIADEEVGLNGKINNLAGALPHARHGFLVISDSDVHLRPDYLSTMIAPLADERVGAVTSFFRATHAGPWYEQMELLTLNADHFALAMLAKMLHLADFCFGASTALRRETLEQIGGLAVLGSYLVEDNEFGRRVLQTGRSLVVVPYVIDTLVDLGSAREWWRKQMYWDQNTRAAIPALFSATLLLRVIPLSLILAALSGGRGWAVSVLLCALAIRLAAAGAVLWFALDDARSLRSLWLLPLKDCLSLVWFVQSFTKRTVVWRGVEMALTRDGRLQPLVERTR